MALCPSSFDFLVAIFLCLICVIEVGGKSHHKKAHKGKHCNLFKGKWVFDGHYPIYSPSSCPFVEAMFDCQKNGRPDRMYLKYRWKPNHCNLPRFNGKDFLKRFRNKKIMFVGDSLSLNQWQSLTCMLHTALPDTPYSLSRKGALSNFEFPEYGVSIMFMRNAFLVDLEGEKANGVLKLDTISGGNEWKEADMLIFNTYHWWGHKGHIQRWHYLQYRNKSYTDMNRLKAFEIALKTWAHWIDSNIDFSKTKVYFQGVSPAHYYGKEWNQPEAQRCLGQIKPLEGPKYPTASEAEAVVKGVLHRMAKQVHLLDITLLSQLRVDGHPSAYANANHTGMDCSHWCLAGVPDTWNQLLYATIVRKHKKSFKQF